MISTRQAVCMKCAHVFTVREEKSRRAHLLYCVRCGRDKRIVSSDLTEHYHRYLSTLLATPSAGPQGAKEPVKPLFSDGQLDIRKYVYMVEHIAGTCVCGSVFRFSAKPRCPRCRSTALRTDPVKKSCDLPLANGCTGEQ